MLIADEEKESHSNLMYAAFDLYEKSIQRILNDDEEKIIRESKLGEDYDCILRFLDGTQAKVFMESGYNHEYVCNVQKEREWYDVAIATL